MNLVVEHADYFQALALHQDGFSDGGRTLECALGCVVTKDDDAAMVDEVTFFKVAPFLKTHQSAHRAIRKFDTAGGERDDARTDLVAKVVAGLGADGANEWNLGADCFDVGVFEVNAMAGALASGLHAGLAGPDDGDVVPHVADRFHYAAAEAAPEGKKKHNRDHTPGDAEHGECGAHAVALECRPALHDQFFQAHGASRFIRNAGTRQAPTLRRGERDKSPHLR